MKLPISQGCALLILESKGQIHSALITEIVSGAKLFDLCTYHEASNTATLWVQDVPYWFFKSKFKVKLQFKMVATMGILPSSNSSLQYMYIRDGN